MGISAELSRGPGSNDHASHRSFGFSQAFVWDDGLVVTESNGGGKVIT